MRSPCRRDGGVLAAFAAVRSMVASSLPASGVSARAERSPRSPAASAMRPAARSFSSSGHAAGEVDRADADIHVVELADGALGGEMQPPGRRLAVDLAVEAQAGVELAGEVGGRDVDDEARDRLAERARVAQRRRWRSGPAARGSR